MPREHILNLTPEELTAQLAPLNMPRFRATQILEWIYQKRATSFDQMTNLSLPDRTALAERFDIFTSQITRHVTSVDQTQKLLLQWPDLPSTTAESSEPSESSTESTPAPQSKEKSEPANGIIAWGPESFTACAAPGLAYKYSLGRLALSTMPRC